MHRLFIALRPPRAIRESLSAMMTGVPGARWQDDAQLHLTLRFIGVVDRRMAEDVADVVSGLSAPAPMVALAGVGRFAHKGRTDTLWAGVQPHDALAALHRKVDHAIVRAGLPPEHRAYLPHVTLARLARGAGVEAEIGGWIAAHAGRSSAPFQLARMILYESHLGSGGAVYEPVADIALR